MHYLRPYETQLSRITKKWLNNKSCRFDKNMFSASYFFIHMFNVCNESAKYQSASTNTLR